MSVPVQELAGSRLGGLFRGFSLFLILGVVLALLVASALGATVAVSDYCVRNGPGRCPTFVRAPATLPGNMDLRVLRNDDELRLHRWPDSDRAWHMVVPCVQGAFVSVHWGIYSDRVAAMFATGLRDDIVAKPPAWSVFATVPEDTADRIVLEVSSGFPFRAMHSRRVVTSPPDGEVVAEQGFALGDGGRVLPLGITPLGLLANSLLYAMVFATTVRTGRWVRSAWRTSRGRCPCCGYDVSKTDSRTCPECGSGSAAMAS